MRPLTLPLPQDEVAAALADQATQIAAIASSFSATIDAEGLGRAVPPLLRGVVAITCHCDLARLEPSAGRRIAALIDENRAAIHREFDRVVGAAAIDAGLTAAVALAGMIGKPWAELEAIPNDSLRGRAASAAMLANAIESAVLAAIVAKAETHHAPIGATLH